MLLSRPTLSTSPSNPSGPHPRASQASAPSHPAPSFPMLHRMDPAAPVSLMHSAAATATVTDALTALCLCLDSIALRGQVLSSDMSRAWVCGQPMAVAFRTEHEQLMQFCCFLQQCVQADGLVVMLRGSALGLQQCFIRCSEPDTLLHIPFTTMVAEFIVAGLHGRISRVCRCFCCCLYALNMKFVL